MGVSVQASSQPSNISIDPFVSGQVVSQRGTGMIKDVATGEITRFGTPTQLQPGQSLQPQQPKLPDPYAIVADELQRGLESAEVEAATTLAQITEKSDYKTLTLEKEFEIQEQDLKRKYLGPTPEGKTAQQQVDEYHAARDSLIVQKQVAAIRLRDKVQPDIDKLERTKQQTIIQLQEIAKERKIRLDAYQELIDSGFEGQQLDEHGKARLKQLQYKVLGWNVPLSNFYTNPRQQLAELKAAISLLEDALDPLRATFLTMSPKEQEQKRQQLYELRKMHRDEMIRQNPQFAAATKRVTLGDANKEIIDNENKGGTIKSLIEKNMPLRSYGTANKTPPKTDPLGVR